MSKVAEDHLQTHLADVRGVHLVPYGAEVLTLCLGQVEHGHRFDQRRSTIGEDDVAVPHGMASQQEPLIGIDMTPLYEIR